ncbi:MAG TPA: response regulator [Aggregatilineales bacterium]|nr:response regulator [Aggregatilineales bacterium]
MENRRALIVEDRSDWQNIIAKALTSMDWEYDIASNFEQALTLVESKYYDLAVIDPVLDNANKYNRDGLRVMAELHKKSPHTHILVVSGSVTQEVLRNDPDVPVTVPVIEKQNWDFALFRGLVIQASIPASDSIGRKTLVRLLRSAIQERPSSQGIPKPPDQNDRRGMPHVLIVEDRPDWQVILTRSIEEEGWYWRCVPNADEALKILQNEMIHFHVVLLDLRLGDADIPLRKSAGWHILDFLKESDKSTRVIIVSGEASRGDVATLFMKYPIAGFIDKDTFKKNELLEIIYELTDKPKLRIQTLGSFQIWRDEVTVDDFGSKSAEQLLKILISVRGEVLSEDELAAMVFANQDGQDAEAKKAALRDIVNTTRHMLEPELAEAADSAFIKQNESGYWMDASYHVSPDFVKLEELFTEGKEHEDAENFAEAIQCYEKAADLYEGEYLPGDRLALWSGGLRTHLQNQFAKLLNRLADLYAQQNNLAKAIETAQKCLKHNAYHESTHRRLMRYHSCMGNKDAALTVYTTLEKLLREFFGEEPSAETQNLKYAIESGESVPCVERSSDS